ncbi:hypothetical protein EGW08_012341 [Elysia chlorotica]|uniref:Uncharacterized protein n=1 Tax=Elysia chlorotica TaxID=188477 RepID=A0A3S0ZPR3_ELYCH|nr:hypothetical protein EGW08_012341 [Elysia chlorotica]
MTKVPDITQPLVSKLNLDLEELQPKYNKILPEIFKAMEHVNNVEVRAQLECLLGDVYSTFLQPEVEKQNARHQPSQFLEIIKRVIQSSPNTSNGKFLHAKSLKSIQRRATSKLDKAKALFQQVENLDAYFDGLLATLPEAEVRNNEHEARSSQRSKSSSSESKGPAPAPGCADSNKSVASTVIKTHSCAAAPLGGSQVVELPPLATAVSMSPPEEDGDESQAATSDNCKVEDQDSEMSTQDRRRLLHKLLGKEGCDKDDDQREKRSNPIVRARSKLRFVQETDKIKKISEGVWDFQLNPPPRYLFESNAKAEHDKQENPCRVPINLSHDSADTSNGRAESESQRDKPIICTSDSDIVAFSRALTDMLGFSQGNPVGDSEASTQSAPSQVDPKLPGLVKEVKTLGLSLQERKNRVGALKKSNALLREQISEVEGTLESFDKYLDSVKDKLGPVPLETIQREMYAFQEAMIERIFSCIEVLSAEMKALRKTNQTKAAKLQALLNRYEDTKKETPETLLTFGNSKKPATPPPSTPRQLITAELKRCLKAVVTGIECFHASCEDIWDETLSRIFGELDCLFTSLPSPPVERWTPDNPCAVSDSSLSSLDGLEEDIKVVNSLPKDKSKYGAMVVFSLRILERVSSEFSHLMVITRIKDLQIISIDHNIGMAYMSMRQMAIPRIKNTPNLIRRTEHRKNVWKLNKPEKKRKVQNENEPKQAAQSGLTHPEENLAIQGLNIEKKLKNPSDEICEPKGQPTMASPTKYVYPEQLLQSGDAPCHPGDALYHPDHAHHYPGRVPLHPGHALHHMGDPADRKLPLILEDCPQTLGSSYSTQSSSLCPWAQQEKWEHTKRSVRGANTHTNNGGKQKKNKTNFPKIQAVTNQNLQQPAAVGLGTPVKFVQEHVELCDERSDYLYNVSNKAQGKENHRPIQYCRFLAAPIPPSTKLIPGDVKETRSNQRKPLRKPRFRLTSNDLSAHDRGDIHNSTEISDAH